jgi:subtilisin family serine protease
MCAAIQRARERRRKLHVFVDQQGLFDISDKMPLISSSLGNFAEDSLSELLNQKAFSRITLRDYREGVANERFSSGEKALLALALARCLMDFFDEELELASYSWKPERIYFPRSSYAHASSRVLYISLRPKLSGPKSPDLLKGVEPGNPVLLSFARLLLEIDSGEEIPMEIHPESRANVSKWAEMCAFVHEAEREGFSNYLRAVEGCLYLHLALPRSQNQATSSAASEVLRKVIYEQIVRNLELVVNPQSSKRRRRDSASELPQTKKLSISQPPDTDSREVLLVSPEITAAPIPSPLRRQFVSCNRPDSSTQPPKLAIRQNIELPTEIQKRLLCVKDSSEDTVVIEQQLVSMKSVEELEEAFSFSLYDEQGEENASNRPKAKTYFDRLERIKRRFIRPLAHKPTDKLPARLRQAIKIAIIDSGIDMTDPLVMGGALRIREKRNWTDSDPENWHDTYGHGTHVARLVIKVAPAAEIYIARVSTQKQIDANDTHLIAAVWSSFTTRKLEQD